jgi:uncharacterized protein (TIRG00374 family)
LSRSRKPLLIGLACSAIFLFLALRQVKLADLASAIAKARPAPTAVMAVLILIDPLVRGARWRLLLPKGKETTTLRLFQLEAIGLAINNVLPFRLGELARGYLAARELGIPIVTALASIVVERLFDMLTLLALLLFAGDWGASAPAVHAWAQRAFVGALLAAAALIWLERQGKLSFPRQPKLTRFIEQVSLGAKALAHLPSFAGVVVLSALLWGLGAGQFLAAGAGLGVSAMTYPLAVMTVGATAASTALPAVPGYIGAWEFAAKSVLVRAGAEEASALGLAWLLHMSQLVLGTGLGLFFLYQRGHSLSTIHELKEAAA